MKEQSVDTRRHGLKEAHLHARRHETEAHKHRQAGNQALAAYHDYLARHWRDHGGAAPSRQGAWRD